MLRLMLDHRVLHRSVTVEVLPGDASTWISDGAEKSQSPFLLTENNLGVPETELHQAYLFAVRIFAATRKLSRFHTSSYSTMTPVIQDVVDSSAVLIFMNPAHQTALNARKRLIEHKLIDMGQEFKFTAALLSCRHCCKQGELWYHRRWLLQRIYPIQRSHQGADIALNSQNFYLAPNDLSVEMNLVTRACELYPRNYFAWTHRTICIQSTLTSTMHPTTSDVFTEIFSKEVLGVTQWIESHISDYGAVNHLKTLAHLVEDVEKASLLHDLQRLLPLIGHAITLVRAFPEHETLWMYLRGFWVEEDITRAFVTSFVLPLQSTGMLDEESESRECPCGARHARHFLEWRGQGLN